MSGLFFNRIQEQYYDAQSYDIEIVRSRRRSKAIEIKPGGRIIVRVPLLTTEASARRFVEQHSGWIEKHLAKIQAAERIRVDRLTDEELDELVKKAKEIIPERVAYYAPLIGVDYGRITIRNQRTRWGSCSAKGNLNFNCLLMLTPPEVIDSVVVHELCHRLEMNHSRAFYAQVLRVFPEYKKWDKWLKANGNAIMKRNP